MKHIKTIFVISIMIAWFALGCGGGDSSGMNLADSGGSPAITKCDTSPFGYNYNYTPSEIGDIIKVGGIEYVITAMPFLEYGTGEHYYIKVPATKYGGNISFNYTSQYMTNDTSCYPYSFAGLPSSNNEINYYTTYNVYGNFNVGQSASFMSSIKINQTKLTMRMYPNKAIQNTPIAAGDADLTDNVNWEGLGVDTSLVDNTKTLLNYIQIVKIP